MLNNNDLFAMTTHCPQCGKCFCQVPKMQASNGTACCAFCKEDYERRLKLFTPIIIPPQ